MQLHMTPDCFSPSQRKELRAAGWKAGWQLFACVQPGRGAEEGSGERKERRSFVWSGEVKVKWISRVFKEEVWTESCWQTGPQRRTHTHCSGMLVRILLYYFFFSNCVMTVNHSLWFLKCSWQLLVHFHFAFSLLCPHSSLSVSLLLWLITFNLCPHIPLIKCLSRLILNVFVFIFLSSGLSY